MLNHLTEEQWQQSCKSIIGSGKFRPSAQVPFPLVSDLLESCGQTGEMRARNIIAHVREAVWKYGRTRSIDFGDTTLHAVIDRYGGWPSICDWGDDDWKMKETAFVNAYMSAQACGEVGSCRLVGTSEESHRLNGVEYGKPEQALLPGCKPTPQITTRSDQGMGIDGTRGPVKISEIMLDAVSRRESQKRSENQETD